MRTFVSVTLIVAGFSAGALLVMFLMFEVGGGLKDLPLAFIAIGGFLVAGIVDRLATPALLTLGKRYWPLLGLIGAILAAALFIVALRFAGNAQA